MAESSVQDGVVGGGHVGGCGGLIVDDSGQPHQAVLADQGVVGSIVGQGVLALGELEEAVVLGASRHAHEAMVASAGSVLKSWDIQHVSEGDLSRDSIGVDDGRRDGSYAFGFAVNSGDVPHVAHIEVDEVALDGREVPARSTVDNPVLVLVLVTINYPLAVGVVLSARSLGSSTSEGVFPEH